MNKIALILAGLLLFQPGFALADDELKKPIDVTKYIGHFGYFLKALRYAKYLHPSLAVPNLSEIKVGYSLLRGARDVLKAGQDDIGEGIVKTPIENLSKIGLTVVKTGSSVIGYAFPGSHFLSGAGFAVAYLPTILGYFSGALPGLKESYDLDEFTKPSKPNKPNKLQQTYLACSYTDPDEPIKNFKIWADETRIDDSDTDLKDVLKSQNNVEFRNNTVLMSGRWILANIKGKKYYVFGTIADPVLLESACFAAVASYAKEKKITLDAMENIKISSGNTSLSNSYPIRFYHPVVMKDPSWTKIKPIILRKAVLLVEQPKPPEQLEQPDQPEE